MEKILVLQIGQIFSCACKENTKKGYQKKDTI